MNKNLENKYIESYYPKKDALYSRLRVKIAHLLYWMNSQSFSELSKNFTKYCKIDKQYRDNESKLAFEEFKKNESWLIIWNHSSVTFSDYLVYFEDLWDETISKTAFYNWYKVIDWNRNEFPNIVLRNTNSVTSYKNNPDWKLDLDKPIWWFSWTKEIYKQVIDDAEMLNNEENFVFLLPMWYWDDWNFLWIFKKIIKNLNDDVKILLVNTEHSKQIWWIDMLKTSFLSRIEEIIWHETENKFCKTTITARIATAWDFKWLNWGEQKQKYYEILWIKND